MKKTTEPSTTHQAALKYTNERRSFTRAMKNARYLQKVAPHIVPEKEPAEGYGSIIPTHLLARLHRLRHDSPELHGQDTLVDFLKEHKIPGPSSSIRGPLFHGTIYFVQVSFQTPAGNVMVPTPDMDTILQYAQHAIVPISEYARQYGPNSVSLFPSMLTYGPVPSIGTSYADSHVQTWVTNIVHENDLPSNACIFIVSPPEVTISMVGGNSGYHGVTDRIPYIILGVFSRGLQLRDLSDEFAMGVSHEIGEMVVDPFVDHSNPEVCDPCDINCRVLYRAYFDDNDHYLNTTQTLPPGFDFSYYICPVVRPAGASSCPASAEDCGYPPIGIPPFELGKLLGELASVQILYGVTNDASGVVVLPGGVIVHIPPFGPPDPISTVLVEVLGELARAAALNKVAAGSINVEARKLIEKAVLQMATQSLEKIGHIGIQGAR